MTTPLPESTVASPAASTWEQLGLCPELIKSVTKLGWKTPTPIQAATLPKALEGKDLIGIANTGSGKSGSYILPMLQSLLDSQSTQSSWPFGLVLTPTRELAVQISLSIKSLLSGVKTCILMGGTNKVIDAINLQKQPHFVIGTVGRILDHLTDTKGFSLSGIQFLVLDEADRLLDVDFEKKIMKIIKECPRNRTTFLYSATINEQVQRLQSAVLHKPETVTINSSHSTVTGLKQSYILMPWDEKYAYLSLLIHDMKDMSVIVFCSRIDTVQRASLVLRKLGVKVVSLFGDMSQPRRMAALNSFKDSSNGINVLVCTDVASRGIDIPYVNAVVNFDLPISSKVYIHRVGRTARAGRSGLAVNMVTQYDVELLQRIETALNKRIDKKYDIEPGAVGPWIEKAREALRETNNQLREQGDLHHDSSLDDIRRRKGPGGKKISKNSNNRNNNRSGNQRNRKKPRR